MITKVLIANRGEIAVRLIRAAKELGIKSVAIYSEADRNALHTALADEAILIGASEPSESYLNMEAILLACGRSGADAVHPGYGFLSEQAQFARTCEKNGLTFIGPSSQAMELLGDKISAKTLAQQAGVPLVPGYFRPGADEGQLASEASRIGFPILLKASAGGGGRGMRVVSCAEEFAQAFAMASKEALTAFGNSSMMIEKLIERPRHIEVQFLADRHFNVAPLFERDCTLQRRHQKMIEEAPSPVMDDRLWQAMMNATTALVKAAGYVGAGTAEFLFDPGSRAFYFLEVNARLQVEHPVTEAISGLDLAKWQFKIASGVPLPADRLAGDRRQISGHAIEARIIAEDPARNFLPSTGKILGWAEPRGVRVDTGYSPGSEVSRYYDSLLAKVIAHAETRSEAIEKLALALEEFHILGVKTNVSFLIELLKSQAFAESQVDTDFVTRELGDWQPSALLPDELAAIAQTANGSKPADKAEDRSSIWNRADSWRLL